MKLLRFVCIAFTILCFQHSLVYGNGDTTKFVKIEVMVPMRDGVKLFTRIYKPLNVKEKLPVLMMRSPYSSWNIGTQSPERTHMCKAWLLKATFLYTSI